MFSAPQYGLGRTPHFQNLPSPQTQAPQDEPTAYLPPEDWRFTHHAKARSKQRGVDGAALQALLDWGKAYPCGGGGRELVLFRKRDLDKLSQHLPKAERLAVEKQRRLFAVVGQDGAVVTVGHRSRHIWRH